MQVFRRVLAISLSVALLASGTPAHALSRVQAVSFIDENTGYIGGWYPTQKGFVSYTTDKGVSWTATSTANLPISAIAAGPSGAWATAGEYSGKALAVTNPGLQWAAGTTIYSNAVPSQIIRLASGRLVAVGQLTAYYRAGTGWHGKVAFIATSDDQGVSWTLRSAGPLYALLPSGYPEQTWAAMADVDATADGSVLWAVGNEWNASESSKTTLKRRLVYRSVDGGLTWALQLDLTPPQTPPPALNCVTVASATTAYAFGANRAGVKTINGGSTWAALTMPVMTTVGSSASIVAADAVDANTVVIAGNHPTLDAVQIARTTDGGASAAGWSVYPVDLGFKLHDLEMITPSHGIAVGSNEAISHSWDGGASWSYPQGERAPSITRSQPAANFSYHSGPVTVSGTSNDGVGNSPGVGVERVEVLIRQADGRTWDGTAWTPTETWVRAGTSDGWKNWSYVWQPDGSLLSAPATVSVATRATDAIGLQKSLAPLSSRVMTASVLVAGGASHTDAPEVTAKLSVSANAPDATRVRWRVGTGPYSDWAPWLDRAADVAVTLPHGDGTKTVTFEFANAAQNVLASASDSIILDATGPAAALTSPPSGFDVEAGTVLISGTSSDALSGVSSADIRFARSDGMYWDGAGWTAVETWVPAQSLGADGAFAYEWTPDPEMLSFVHTVGVSARVRDAVGNSTTTPQSVSSAARPIVSLASGSSHTSQTVVPATLSGPAAAFMRWRVAGGATSAWIPYATMTNVTVPGGDGAKTVTFDFAQDAGPDVVASSSDGIVLDTGAPSVTVVAPSEEFSYLGGPVAISGTSTDTLSGVGKVEVRIARNDGFYWNGAAWVTAESWIPAQTSNGWKQWSLTWVPDVTVRGSESIVSVTARATDSVGLASQTAPVVSSKLEAAITLAEGAPVTSVPSVDVSVTAPGASHMRWRVDGGTPSEWVAYAPSTTIVLGEGEGPRAVSFDFAAGDDTGVVVVSASDDIVLDTEAPSVAIAGPVEGFVPTGSQTLIAGTSGDAVSGVSSVHVRIARSDGLHWNGVGWTDQEHWVPAAVAGGGSTWSLTWALDPGVTERVRTVTVTARATDAAGHSTDSAALLSSPPQPAISVAGGATHTAQLTIPVMLTGAQADTVRWSVGGGEPSAWQPYATTVDVSLPPGDGAKSVKFEFASDGALVPMADATDEIVLDTSPPELAVVAPAAGAGLSKPSPMPLSATASDAHADVESVGYLVRRADGRTWNGSGWGWTHVWTPLTPGGSGAWTGAWTPPVELLESGQAATIEYRATDSLGHQRTASRVLPALADRSPLVGITSPTWGYYITSTAARTVSGYVSDALSGVARVEISIRRSDGYYWTGGSWVTGERWIPASYLAGSYSWSARWTPNAALVKSGRAVQIRARAWDSYGNSTVSLALSSSARTKASMSRPTLSSRTIRRGRTYRATGSLKPRHTAGTKPVKIYAYRYVRGKYRYYRAFSATASNYSSYTKYTAKVRLPYRGKWRLRAVHSDTQHLKSYSSYRYVTVR